MTTTNAALSQLIAIDPSKKWVIEFEAKVGDGTTDLTVVLYPTARGDSFRVQLVTDSFGMGKVVASAPTQPDVATVTPFPMIESQNVAVRFEYYDDPNLSNSFSGIFVNGILALDTTSVITARWGGATEAQVILQNASLGDAYVSSFQSVIVGSTDTTSVIGNNPVTIFDPNDPYAANVVLYLDFEGGDGNVVGGPASTAILDKSTYTHPITVNSDGGIVSLVSDNFAPISTKSADFVTQAGASFLHASGGSELDLGGITHWTIEAMIKLPALGQDMIIVDKDGSYGLHMSSYQFGVNAAGKLWIALQHSSENSGGWTLTSDLVVPLNEWVHVAAVRDGSNYHLFVDGTGKTDTTSYELAGVAGAGTVQVGAMLNTFAWHALEFKGEMDNLRITSGVSRYTSNFSIAYPISNGSNTTTITAPANNGTLTGSTANIVVGYTTLASSSGVSSVDLYIDKTDTTGTPDYTETLVTPYLKSGSVTFVIDTTLIPNGNHTVIAVTRHLDGSTAVSTESSLVAFVVDNVEIMPVVAITAPTDGSSVKDIVKVEVTATSANLLSPTINHPNGIDHVILTIDGVSHTLQAAPPYFYNWDTTIVALGDHTLVATAFDTRGNEATTTVNLTVTTPDAPTVAFTSPNAGDTLAGTSVVSVTATDVVGMSKVDFYVDSTLIRTMSTGPYSINWNSLSVGDGAHNLKVVATNIINVTTTVIQPIIVKNAPTVTILTPSANYAASGIISVLASAVPPAGATIQSVTFLLDGAPFATSNTAPYTATLDTTLLSNAGHVVSAIATTSQTVSGSSAGVTIVVNNVVVTPPEPTPTTPTISFLTPAANAIVAGNVDFTLQIGAPLGVDHVVIKRGAMTLATLNHYPYNLSWNSKEVVDGNYTFSAIVTDAGGQMATATVTLTVRNGVGVSGAIPGDPYWSNVVLLLQSRETLGGSTVTDTSDYRHRMFADSTGLSNDRTIFNDDSLEFRYSQTPSIKTESDPSFVVSEDFTYEGWIYLQANDQVINLLQLGNNNVGVFSIFLKNTGVYVKNGSQSSVYLGASVPVSSWQHVVVQRTGDLVSAFVGGKPSTITTSISGELGGTGSIVIGSTDGTGTNLPFYMDEIRLTNGVARYSSTFQVPQTQFADYGVTDSNWPSVTLMLHTLGEIGSNHFRDYSDHPARMSPQGPVQLVMSTASPGEVAAKFNGQNTGITSTRVVTSMSQFTAEAFITPVGSLDSRILSAQSALAPSNVFALELNADGSVKVLLGATNSQNQFTLVTAPGVVRMDGNQRQHVAVTRDNTGVVSIWVQGALAAAQTCTIALTNLPAWKIGSYDGTSKFFQGTIDEVRVTEGVARYTAAFTPYVGLAPTLKPAFALESFYSLIADHIV